MDSLSTQKAKPRKMKVSVKKSRYQRLLDLFYRSIEIIVVMVTVAKLCYQLVITFESFGRTGFLVSRHLAFVLGNAIVIIIVAKCGFFVNQEPNSQRNKNDFLDEFVQQSSRRDRSLQTNVICREKQKEEAESSGENRTKQSIEDKRQSRAMKQRTEENSAKQSSEDKKQSKAKQIMIKKDISVKRSHKQIIAQNQESPLKSYERSQSENLEVSKKSSCEKLKRSETERSANRCYTDEELRYKIESFIARQRRNQKDEEFI